MNYQVSEKQGESLRIGLREIGEGQYEVTIGGETVHVDAVRSGRTIYSVIEEGQQFEVVVDEKGGHDFDVLVGGRIFHLESVDERTRLLAGPAAPVATGLQTVAAAMPGKVVKVSVPVGTAVDGGQGIVVLEAMKMENEIPSPIDGVVVEIAVREGDTVEAGSTLFIVEPTADVD